MNRTLTFEYFCQGADGSHLIKELQKHTSAYASGLEIDDVILRIGDCKVKVRDRHRYGYVVCR